MNKYDKLLLEIKEEFSNFELLPKDNSKMMNIIDFILKITSFGKNKFFMQKFVTTIGNKVYLPTEWLIYSENVKCEILRHERVHMRQAKEFGNLLFSFLYLFVFFPIGFAYYRAKFEKEAYEESLRALYEYHGADALLDPKTKKIMVEYFVGPSYGWMFPFRTNIEKWYDNFIKIII